MAELPEPEVRITRYEVSCLPEGDINARGFTLTVEYRGRGLWAVLDGLWCLGTDGEWDYEMRPSEREDGWLATHRFDIETALRLAKEAAPDMTVNGHTVADALSRIAEREAKA